MARWSLPLLLSGSMIALLTAAGGAAATVPPERDRVEEVVVTGSFRVRQGGAQDINHFRGQAVAGIPMHDTLTAEGLMGGYDLQIPGPACGKLFCLTGEATRADLLMRPKDQVFVGLGFNTAIKPQTWTRGPLNLVAVVDKSGSMNGSPLELVRQSLLQIVGQLGAGDQISIVLYGDRSHVHLAPTMVTAANRADVVGAILAIQSAGSTNMEAGLQVGYRTAFETREAFKGATRVMLFTDERPNVGRTDAGGFVGMAQAASEKGVGLTTIGVGVQFDAALATKVSSTRGGNLYFMRDAADVKSVFEAKLDTMVSELAHDLELKLAPAAGYKVSAVYGVPGEALEWGEEGSIRLRVPTAFLSTEGGGLFVTLTQAAANLPQPRPDGAVLDVGLSYRSARDGGLSTDTLAVAPAAGPASANLRLAHMLVDEYLGLKEGSAAFHNGDEEAAYKTFRALSQRLGQLDDKRLAPERKMVDGLLTQTAYLAGYSSEGVKGEAPKEAGPIAMLGTWEVTLVLGEPGLRRGDRIQLRPENAALLVRKARPDEREDAEYESDGRRVRLTHEEKDALFAYRVKGDRMTLVLPEDGSTVNLKRVPRPGAD